MAGVTRWYAGIKPDAWFSFDLDVTPGEPFNVRGIETFDEQEVESYDVAVNGELGNERVANRAGTGDSLVTFQVYVPDDGEMTSICKVAITMRYMASAPMTHRGRGCVDALRT